MNLKSHVFAGVLLSLSIAATPTLGADSGRSDSDPSVVANSAVGQSVTMNGFRLNGFRLNGYRFNGFRLNGFRLNGLTSSDGLAPLLSQLANQPLAK